MYGWAPEQFNCPWDMTFDNEGYLYAVDRYNHCIKKFTSTGKYISNFGSEGCQLQYVTSIIIHNNLVYVTRVW